MNTKGDLTGKQIMGLRLKQYRESLGLSIPELEAKVKIRRSYLYKIEAGTANFGIDLFEKILGKCGVTLAEYLAGLRTAPESSDHEDLYQMLDSVVRSKIPRQIEGVRILLEAVSLNVNRLLKAQDPSTPSAKPAPAKARLSPSKTTTAEEKGNLVSNEKKKLGKGRTL